MKRLNGILRSLRSAWVATREHLASGRSSRNVLERFGVVAVRLGRHEGTLGLGGGRPAAFWSVLERLDGIFNAILKRGGPLGSPRRNTWLRGRASRSVLKRFEAFGRHFRSWRSRDRRSHQGPAAQHIESRGPAPAGPCGAPAGAGALRFADRRPWVLNLSIEILRLST